MGVRHGLWTAMGKVGCLEGVRVAKGRDKRKKAGSRRNQPLNSSGAAYRIRTCDVLIRSQTLYPAEVTPRKCRGYNASVIWCRSRVNFCQERSSHFCHIRCMDCDGLWPRNAFSAWWTSTDLPKRDFLTGVGCVVPYTYPPRAICMGSGGVTPRTWSGPGGSSHKRPLAGTRTYAGRFFRLWSHEVRRWYQLYR